MPDRLSKHPEWQKPCAAGGRRSVPEGVPSPPARRCVRVFTLHTPPPRQRSPGPLNPSVPFYCRARNSHFYVALFTTRYQKQEDCRDQQRLWAHVRNKTHDSVVFVKLKLHPAHLCSNKPGSGKLHAACSFQNRGLFKKLHAATFFLYQHILVCLVVMLIVILGCVPSLRCSGHQQTKLDLSQEQVQSNCQVYIVTWNGHGRDFGAVRVQQDGSLHHCSCTLTKGEPEYCQCHRRNTKLSADFEELCPGAAGRHQMAEIDLQHNSHNTARCFVHLGNNDTAPNPHCWDPVKLVKVPIHWGTCLFWKRKWKFLKSKLSLSTYKEQLF